MTLQKKIKVYKLRTLLKELIIEYKTHHLADMHKKLITVEVTDCDYYVAYISETYIHKKYPHNLYHITIEKDYPIYQVAKKIYELTKENIKI